MWELDYKESWALKSWCFWSLVLEKTLESPLSCKEIQAVHPKVNQSCVFTGRTDIEAETPIFWPPDAKSWVIWKDPDAGKYWGKEEKGTTEHEMVRLCHRLNGHEFGWTLGVGDVQGSLACCGSWAHEESGTTELLNWTEPQLFLLALLDWNYPIDKCTSQMTLVVNNLSAHAGDFRDSSLIPRLGRSPGVGNCNPLQYSCLENPMNRGA